MAAVANNTIIEAPKPEPRVRSNGPVVAVSILIIAVVVIGGLAAGAFPLVSKIKESNSNREYAVSDTADLQAQRGDLETKRDAIKEQYQAIKVFTEKYPATPEQDALFSDLQNLALFAGVNIESIATKYPELLSEGITQDGTVVTPDQVVLNGDGSADDGDPAASGDGASAPPAAPDPSGTGDGTDVVSAAPGTDVNATDSDSYPLGTIPLTVTADLDGSRVFVDDKGTTYVASPALGYYTFGGDTGRQRLSMAVAVDSTPASIQKSYLSGTGTSTSGWSTVFSPDKTLPPYKDIKDFSTVTSQQLVDLYPRPIETETVAAPTEWVKNNGYVELTSISRSAWLIDEIHNSPGRAILIRFVSASGNGIVVSGQQFILRELPPLPESIFGDLNGDGVISDSNTSAGPTPAPVPSPSATN